jgi:hypothetical protein
VLPAPDFGGKRQQDAARGLANHHRAAAFLRGSTPSVVPGRSSRSSASK